MLSVAFNVPVLTTELLCDAPGAEPAAVPSLSAALDAGRPVCRARRGQEAAALRLYVALYLSPSPPLSFQIVVGAGPTLADGLLVPKVGTNAFALCRKHVDKVRSLLQSCPGSLIQ